MNKDVYNIIVNIFCIYFLLMHFRFYCNFLKLFDPIISK